MKLLHNARIIDDDPLDLASALIELSPQCVEAALHQALEEHPSSIDRQIHAGFNRSLGPGQSIVEIGPLTSGITRLVLHMVEGGTSGLSSSA
jgi:hypothetical protein